MKKIYKNGQIIYANNSKIYGDGNTIIGDGNKIRGNRTKVIGNDNKIRGSDCNVSGNNNKCIGQRNTMTGHHNKNICESNGSIQSNPMGDTFTQTNNFGSNVNIGIIGNGVVLNNFEPQKEVYISFPFFNNSKKPPLTADDFDRLPESTKDDLARKLRLYIKSLEISQGGVGTSTLSHNNNLLSEFQNTCSIISLEPNNNLSSHISSSTNSNSNYLLSETTTQTSDKNLSLPKKQNTEYCSKICIFTIIKGSTMLTITTTEDLKEKNMNVLFVWITNLI